MPAVISTGLPHLMVPFLDRAVMMDVELELREHIAEVCSSYGCKSAALVAPAHSGTIADADVCVRIFDADELGGASRLLAGTDLGSDGQPGEVRVAGTVVPLIGAWVTSPDVAAAPGAAPPAVTG